MNESRSSKENCPCLAGIFSYVLRRITWIVPIIYVIFLLLFQPFTWIDNTCMAAAMVWGEPSPHLIYVGYLLSYPMMWGRILFPQIEWFTTFQHLLFIVSITVLAHYTLRHSWRHPGVKHIAGLALIVFLTVNLFNQFYFPYVSCIGMASGLVLMLYGVRRCKPGRFWWGCLLLLASASLRYDSSPLLLVAAGVLSCLYIINKKWRQLSCVLLAASFSLGVYLIQPLFSTVSTWEVDEKYPAQNLLEINDARMSFCDYSDPRDKEKIAEYKQLECSENDKQLLSIHDMTLCQRSNSEWWRKIYKLREKDNDKYPTTLNLLWERFQPWFSFQILFLAKYAILPLLLLCIPLPRRWNDERIWIFAAWLASVLILILIGRVNVTSIYAILYLILPLMLFGMPDVPFKSVFSFWAFSLLLCVLVMGSVRTLFLPSSNFGWIQKSRYSPLNISYWKPELTNRIREECAQHPERQYFLPVHLWWRGCMPSSSMFSEPYSEWKNVFPIYHWVYILPSIHQELHQRGVKSDLTLFFNQNYRYIINTRKSCWVDNYERIAERSLILYAEHYGVYPRVIMERELGENWWVCRIECYSGDGKLVTEPALK